MDEEFSILNSVKKMIGISSDYKVFDQDLIVHINSVFMILHQLGIGPKNGLASLMKILFGLILYPMNLIFTQLKLICI